ncbi:putative pyridoxal kinase [Oleoguttula sp. CCFEE 5521]
MATFCMQTLGCEVSAIHTVNYSNHVAYRRVKGRKTPASEITELYTGLKSARLNDFDMLLSGYCPSAEAVEAVGLIARELRLTSTLKPGSFFWVLDPVMGDNGRIYVAEECVPVYRSLLKDADLILPNQFEAELLSGVKINDLASMRQAIATLHQEHRTPHVLITSIRLPATTSSTPSAAEEDLATSAKLSVVGSTATSDMKPRLFRITVTALPIFFSGTGDMFASLMSGRLRQAAASADLLTTKSWQSPDDVLPHDLPLAKAAEKVLASMHAVLKDTAKHYDTVIEEWTESHADGKSGDDEAEERHLRFTRAAEVRVVRNAGALREPPGLGDFIAVSLEVGESGVENAEQVRNERHTEDADQVNAKVTQDVDGAAASRE